MMITGKNYDRLKSVVQVWMPAAGTLYFTLAQIWGLPGAEQVLGTLAAIATFFGVTLKISSSNYEKSGKGIDGAMVVKEGEDGSSFLLELDATPEELEQKKTITFRVDKRPLKAG